MRAVCALVPLLVGVLGDAALGAANGPAETSLDACQQALHGEGRRLAEATQKALATCLGKASSQIVRRDAGITDAVSTCAREMLKIRRTDGRSLGDLFALKAQAKCTPGVHSLGDILGDGSENVSEPLDVASLARTCQPYGGDGSVDSLAKWLECARTATECQVFRAIRTDFPRAVEWLDQVADALTPGEARTAVQQVSQDVAGGNGRCPQRLIVCDELDPCIGAVPRACVFANDDSDQAGGGIEFHPNPPLTFGSWANPFCGTSGVGWHAGGGSCQQGQNGLKRCQSILAEVR